MAIVRSSPREFLQRVRSRLRRDRNVLRELFLQLSLPWPPKRSVIGFLMLSACVNTAMITGIVHMLGIGWLYDAGALQVTVGLSIIRIGTRRARTVPGKSGFAFSFFNLDAWLIIFAGILIAVPGPTFALLGVPLLFGPVRRAIGDRILSMKSTPRRI